MALQWTLDSLPPWILIAALFAALQDVPQCFHQAQGQQAVHTWYVHGSHIWQDHVFPMRCGQMAVRVIVLGVHLCWLPALLTGRVSGAWMLATTGHVVPQSDDLHSLGHVTSAVVPAGCVSAKRAVPEHQDGHVRPQHCLPGQHALWGHEIVSYFNMGFA